MLAAAAAGAESPHTSGPGRDGPGLEVPTVEGHPGATRDLG